MEKDYIVFMDSGIGGLSTLAESYKLCPQKYIYFSDNANCPFGSKSNHQIFKLLETAINNLTSKYSVKTVVLACNTATTSSIKKLRSRFPNIKFIGTEPAIKLASSKGYKRITVLCTPATARQKKYINLTHQSKTFVSTHKMPKLAFLVEQFFCTQKFCVKLKLLKVLYAEKSRDVHSDALVLGCTHYCLIKSQISKIFGLPVFDGNFGVAKQVLFACNKFDRENNSNLDKLRKKQNDQQNFPKNAQNLLKNSQNFKNDIIFVFSNPTEAIKEKYMKTFMQILANKENLC